MGPDMGAPTSLTASVSTPGRHRPGGTDVVASGRDAYLTSTAAATSQMSSAVGPSGPTVGEAGVFNEASRAAEVLLWPCPAAAVTSEDVAFGGPAFNAGRRGPGALRPARTR